MLKIVSLPALTRLAPVALLALVAVSSTACGNRYIESFDPLKFDQGTLVADMPENREVLEVVGAYKDAMEKRDPQRLQGLVAEEYYENSGTSDTSDDDYGRSGLDAAISRLSERVQSLRFEIVVKDVLVEGDRAYVTYEYLWNYMYEVGDTPHWEAGRDLNRMHLVRDQGGLWKISRGL